MADPVQDLTLDALGRAAATPEGMLLVAGRSAPGLFPATAAGKRTARACLDQGLLRVARSEQRGKSTVDWAVITDPGLALLCEQANPRGLLTAFVDSLESRGRQLEDCLSNLKAQQSALAELRQRLDQCLTAKTTTKDHLAGNILDTLTTWHEGGALGDCPLPHLYRASCQEETSIGQFHDTMRQLHQGGRIYLHPWTGPLYEIPEPALALLTGHEVAYYASL